MVNYAEVSRIIKIQDNEYKKIKDLVYSKFGINLGNHKQSLVSGRLNKVLKTNKFLDFKSYYNYVINDSSGEALAEFIDRISTNHTYFFRESKHLDFLKTQVLPVLCKQLIASGEKKIRIWSSASSSGEEAYSIAMVVQDYLEENNINLDFAILGTDISTSALNIASEGQYDSESIKAIPIAKKMKFLTHVDKTMWEVSNTIKSKTLFKRFNLMEKVYPFKNKFHFVFNRNVMIYFDDVSKTHLIDQLHQNIAKDGYLFIGLSETITRITNKFKYIEPGVYQKVDNHG